MRLVTKIQFSCTSKASPVYSSGRSLFQISRFWDGTGTYPLDCFMNEKAVCDEISEQADQIIRVLYSANILSPSMKINVNDLLASPVLKSLIQLSSSRKEQLIDYPSTVVIQPSFEGEVDQQRISRNMLELDKLFRDAVGLKLGYLINKNGIKVDSYMSQIKKRQKAISVDVVENEVKLEDVIFQHGYRLEHIFFNGFKLNAEEGKGVFAYDFDLSETLSALNSISFKGKLIIPAGSRGDAALELISQKARQVGFSKELRYKGSQTWHDMM